MTEAPSQRRNSRGVRAFALVALVVTLLGFGGSIAYAYTIYPPDQSITIGDFVYDDSYVATTSDCSISIWAPYGTLIVNAATMSTSTSGWHYYTFASSTQGTWPATMTCGSNGTGDLVKEDRTFIIATSSAPSTSDIATAVASNVNANTNSAVLNASTSLASFLPTSIWNFSGRTLTSFGTLVADIWANGTRTLTSGASIAADIWAAGTRTLTGAGLSAGSLALQSDVTTASSSLGSAITNSQAAINANTNTSITTASSSLGTVINANTNSAILAASSSIGSLVTNASTSLSAQILSVPLSVWNVASSTLTAPGSIGKQLAINVDAAISGITGGGGGLTAAQVWSYAARTLTDATLTSGSLATLSDVQNATSSLNSAISASQTAVNANTNAGLVTATSSLAAVINANTNSQVLTASTSLGSSLSTIASSITSIPTNVWAAATRTLTSGTSIAADIWAAGTRTLTGAGLSAGSLALQSDVTTASTSLGSAITNSQTAVNSNTNTTIGSASSSLAAVINSNTNSAVLNSSSSIGSLLGNASTSLSAQILNIPALVWANGTRSLTTFGTLAADVWTNGARTLTGAGLTSGSLATLTDVQNASSSVTALVNANTNSQTSALTTTITNASSSITNQVNANTNTASSSIGSLLATITSSITSLPTNIWAAATRTLTGAGLSAGSLALQSDVTTASSSLGSAITTSQTAINANTNSASSSLAAVINTNTNTAVQNSSSSIGSLLGNASSSLSAQILNIPALVWTNGARSLTTFGTLAADVWLSGTRTLTGAGLTSGSLATLTDVQTATSSLGSAITNSQTAINSNTNTTVLNASSSLGTVINSNTNAAVLAASSSIGSLVTNASTSLSAQILSLPASVWNVASSTLTAPGSIGKQLAINVDAAISGITGGGGGLTAAQVWSYATRTLTGAGLSSGSLALQSDVTTASSSLGSAISNSQTAINTNTNTTVATATSSLAAVINANTNTVVTNASTSLSVQILSLPASVWNVATTTLTTAGSIGKQIALNLDAVVSTISGGGSSLTASDIWTYATRTLTGAGITGGSLATLSDVQNASSSLAAAVSAGTASVNTNTNSIVGTASSSLGSAIAGKATLSNQQAGWTVSMSDFGSLLAGTTYRTRVTVLNYQSVPTDPAVAPVVTLYDANRSVVVSGASMTHTATGVYDYTYTVSSSATEGAWETSVGTQVESGKTITTTDYWNVTSAPAQVLIQSMDSTTTPDIGANIRITNEGSVDYEYHYEWCVVTTLSNQCGGGNDTYYASASKLIHPGENFDTVLTATVPTEGQYYFKTVVYFGSQASGASRQFTTAGYVAPSGGGSSGGSGGGGGGSGGGGTVGTYYPTTPSAASAGASDINSDGKVNAVDFSILLAFWKTLPPFRNPNVDLNHDGKVDAVDFSILLFHWGTHT